MNIKFLLNHALFREQGIDTAKSILVSLGIPFEEVTFSNVDKLVFNEFTTGFLPIQSIKRIRKYENFFSWFYYNDTLYDFSNYSFYSNHMLNSSYNILPFGEIRKRFNNNETFFIKSNSGNKLLTGQTITCNKESFDFIEDTTGLNNTSLICYSAAKNIKNEFRFWIIDREIITVSSYDFKECLNKPVDKVMVDFVDKIIKEEDFPFHRAFTMDICYSDDGIKIVECNALSTSGTYHCDLEKLFYHTKKLVLNDVLMI
jgi:hypothetical protein